MTSFISLPLGEAGHIFKLKKLIFSSKTSVKIYSSHFALKTCLTPCSFFEILFGVPNHIFVINYLKPMWKDLGSCVCSCLVLERQYWKHIWYAMTVISILRSGLAWYRIWCKQRTYTLVALFFVLVVLAHAVIT